MKLIKFMDRIEMTPLYKDSEDLLFKNRHNRSPSFIKTCSFSLFAIIFVIISAVFALNMYDNIHAKGRVMQYSVVYALSVLACGVWIFLFSKQKFSLDSRYGWALVHCNNRQFSFSALEHPKNAESIFSTYYAGSIDGEDGEILWGLNGEANNKYQCDIRNATRREYLRFMKDSLYKRPKTFVLLNANARANNM